MHRNHAWAFDHVRVPGALIVYKIISWLASRNDPLQPTHDRIALRCAWVKMNLHAGEFNFNTLFDTYHTLNAYYYYRNLITFNRILEHSTASLRFYTIHSIYQNLCSFSSFFFSFIYCRLACIRRFGQSHAWKNKIETLSVNP